MKRSERRLFLRDGTRAAHETLDAMVGSFDDHDSYRRYLAGIAAFRLPLEAALGRLPMPQPLSGWQPSLVADEIRIDLDAFHLPHPPTTNPQPTQDASALLGLFYVLEGSALGSRLLVRRAAQLGLNRENGAAHLAAQSKMPPDGNNSGWPAFLVLLETAPDFDAQTALHHAILTFDLAQASFAQARESL